MDKHESIEAFTAVFDVWQKSMDEVEPKGRVIQYVPTDNYDKAHIRLVFVHPGSHEERIECADGSTRIIRIPKKMDGSGGVLGYVPKGSQTVYFDRAENWVSMGIDSTGQISLFDVALHEVGHCHDIAHSGVVDSIMSPYYTGESKAFHRDDQAATNAAWSRTKKRIASGSYTL